MARHGMAPLLRPASNPRSTRPNTPVAASRLALPPYRQPRPAPRNGARAAICGAVPSRGRVGPRGPRLWALTPCDWSARPPGRGNCLQSQSPCGVAAGHCPGPRHRPLEPSSRRASPGLSHTGGAGVTPSRTFVRRRWDRGSVGAAITHQLPDTLPASTKGQVIGEKSPVF